MGLLFVFVLGSSWGMAQRKRNFDTYSEQVPKTLVGQFEAEMDVDEFKKDSLRQKYSAHITELQQAIDTLDISDRKRQRLLAIVKVNPFDERLLQAMAESKKGR